MHSYDQSCDMGSSESFQKEKHSLTFLSLFSPHICFFTNLPLPPPRICFCTKAQVLVQTIVSLKLTKLGLEN